MDCIIRHRMLDKEEQFLVRWEGDFEPTWLRGEILRNDCPEMVEEYMQVFYIPFMFLLGIHVYLLPM